MQKRLTPAAYAKSRNLNPSTVSRQIRAQKIPLGADGLVDPAQADAARAENLKARRGGVVLPRHRLTTDTVKPSPPVQAASTDDPIIAALRQIAAPAEALLFAKIALRLGCSAEQAYGLGIWYTCQPALSFHEIDPDDLADFKEPTRERWTELLGDFDFDSAETAIDAATLDEVSPQ